MAKRKEAAEEPVVEKSAAVAEAKPPAPEKSYTHEPRKSVKIPKLASKNKSRLPRRQKKALQKAAGRVTL